MNQPFAFNKGEPLVTVDAGVTVRKALRWSSMSIADPTKRCNHHRRIVAVCCPELGEFIQ
jgi:hypothetical protein